MDRALAHATLPIDDVCKTVRRKDVGDVVSHSFAERLDLDAISLSRRRKCPSSRTNANVRQMAGRPGEAWGAESGTDRLVVIHFGGHSQ